MNWISLHIYHNISFEKILSEHIKPLTLQLKENKEIEGMFFIRYWEKGQHIRYRLLPKKDVDVNILKEKVAKTFEAYFENLCQKELKYRLDFENYEPEVERYGGENLLEIGEKQFQDSSNTILNIINKNSEDWNYSKGISFAIQMHLVFAKEVIVDPDRIVRFFEFSYNRWLYHSVKLDEKGNSTPDEVYKVVSFFENSYQKQKQIINYLIEIIWKENKESKWIDEWSLSCRELRKKMNEMKIEEDKMFSIFDSYLHMTNNRLGVHLRDEAFISFLIINGLKNSQVSSVLM